MTTVIYIISGILMSIGAYLIIKNRPYCMLKSPEVGLAMALYKKKFSTVQMSVEDRKKINYYEENAKKYKLGNFILFIGIPIHLLILFGNGLNTLTPLYYVSTLGLLFIFIRNSNPDPYCIRQKSASDFMETHENIYLKYINVFQKYHVKELLSKDEQLLLDDEKSYQKFFLFYVFGLIFGTTLQLLLDVWFFINNGLLIS